MDTSKIEEIGVDAVRHYINSIACARPFISTNDKTPLWDGSIFVYKNEKFKNEELDFFVHVQVKSHDYAKKIIPDTENHQVRLKDLEQYEKNGGLVYFVVDIDSAKEGHVFYAALTKTRIRNLIKNAKGKQGRSISLKAVPENSNEFLNDIHTVALQSEYPILSLPQLMGEKGWTYEITAERVPIGTNFLDYIATHSVTMLVSRKGDDNKYFVDGISSIQFRKKIEEPIYVGQDKYFDYYYSTSTPNGRKIEIGEALSLLVPYFQMGCDRNDENGKIQMHINFQPKSLESAIHESSFLSEALTVGKIKVGNQELNISPEEEDKCKDFKSFCSIVLDFWQKTKVAFDMLNVDYSDFVPSKLTNRAKHDIEILIRGFIENKPVYSKVDYDHICELTIDNLRVLVGARYKDDNEFQLFNMYDGSVTASAEFDGKRYQVPIVSPLIADYDPIPSNIIYDKLAEAYEKFISINPEINSRANNDGLCLLTQYDKYGKMKHLEAAKELFMWILQRSNDKDESYPIYRINYLQAIKREKTALSEDENDILMNIRENATDKGIKFGCSVLLDENKSATLYKSKMTTKDLNKIKKLPIYNLYKKGLKK